jgi:hypothetical protein
MAAHPPAWAALVRLEPDLNRLIGQRPKVIAALDPVPRAVAADDHTIEPIIACPVGGEQAAHIDSCWGFFGLEVCRVEARAAILAQAGVAA